MRILYLLQKLPDSALHDHIVELTRELVTSGLVYGDSGLSQLPQLVAKFDDAVDIVLDYIETQGLGLAAGASFRFKVLRTYYESSSIGCSASHFRQGRGSSESPR